MTAQQLSLDDAVDREPETSRRADVLLDFVPRFDLEEDVRFWSKVEYNSVGCWLWQAGTDPSGYGTFWLPYLNEHCKAHRWAFLRSGGALARERPFVLHRCDTRACVRPAHLWAGTHAENMADRNRKGRQACLTGEANGFAKLTDDQVREIRRLRDAGVRLRDVGARFGISMTTAHKIGKRVGWAHVSDEVSA